MGNSLSSHQTSSEIKKKPTTRWLWYFLSLVLCVAIISVLAVWVNVLYTENQMAKSILEKYQKLESEKERCGNYLSQKSGDFSEYEYCRKLLNTF